ncbi:D-amino acid oxidase [Cytospora paraplurivora]|uniref:D-amino acid oxidase n=1 Tax=Cytospora paraplurivora TaxID=2898453 RepID=A0AAN9U2B1_9PEZI
MPNIVVVGAGVIGLTTALLLAKEEGNEVTVVAKHMPGDYDIQYTSPWAGGSRQRSRRPGYTSRPSNPTKNGLSDALFDEEPWYSTFLDHRKLRADELPAGMAYGHEVGSVCINTAIYLPWLVGQCRRHGVVLKRASLGHISEAAAAAAAAQLGRHDDHSTGGQKNAGIIIVNCTGVMASRLGGVMDARVTPARGQVVVVRNESPVMYVTSSTDDGPEELAYTMTRAAGGGTVLGGTYQKGNWDANPDPNVATRIMQRVVKAFPEITGGKGVEGLDVIRHGVGLRPYREGGVRLEREVIDGTWVVHNYGHAGWGYQGSYGTAERAVELVNEILGKTTAQTQEKSKL